MTIHKIKLAALCALSALTACRTAHVGPSDGGGDLSAEVQYCFSSGNAGDETVEVLVRNGTGSPVEFVRAELDGTQPYSTCHTHCHTLQGTIALDRLPSAHKARRRPFL